MRNFLLLIFYITFLVSCSSYNDAMKANTNMRKVELGMNKNQVIQIMGKSYHRMAASTDQNGTSIEVLGYPTVDAIYMLHFENDKLKQFHKDLILPTDKVLKETQTLQE